MNAPIRRPATGSEQGDENEITPELEREAALTVEAAAREVHALVHHSWQFCKPLPDARIQRLTELRHMFGDQLNGAFPQVKNLYVSGRVTQLKWCDITNKYRLS